MMSQLVEDFYSQTPGDYFVLIAGVAYVVLAAKNNPMCWIFGVLSSGVLAYLTVTKYGLYADGLLNVFYVIMGLVGLYLWMFGSNNQSALSISRMQSKELFIYFIFGTLFSLLASIFLKHYTEAMATTLDSFTSIFSIIATIWLVKRKLENWILWVIVDLIYVYLYISRGAVLYALLLFIYAVIAVTGFIQWRRLMLSQK